MAEYRLSPSHIALAVVICMVWGGNFVAASTGMTHFPPLLFMALRFALVLLITLPFLRMPPPGQWRRIIAVALFMGSLHFSLLFWALSRSADVSSVAIVQQTYIPMAVVLAIFLVGERVGFKTLGAVLVAFAGVLIVGLDPMVLTQADVVFLTLASALCQALGSIYQRGITGMGVISFQCWVALISVPLMLLGSAVFEQNQLELIRSAQWDHWAAVAYSAIVASLIGHGIFFYLVQRHPVSTVMPYLQMQPVFAVLFGILLWGDRPGMRLLLGGTFVLGSILFITIRASQKTAEHADP